MLPLGHDDGGGPSSPSRDCGAPLLERATGDEAEADPEKDCAAGRATLASPSCAAGGKAGPPCTGPAAAAAAVAAAEALAAAVGAPGGGSVPLDDDGPEERLLDSGAGARWQARPPELAQRRRRRPSIERQLNEPYLVYCCVCLVLTGVLLLITLWEDFAPRQEVHFWRRRLRPWEEAGEAFVGAALCTETLIMFYLERRGFMRDGWRILDIVVAGLTLLCGAFFCFRRACHGAGDVVEDLDVPMLGLRFALQPASEIRELLPAHLRFVQWRLAYSPKVHGVSLSTFYRGQAGPNVVVVRDAHGGLFGGFASEPWRPQAGAYGHSGMAFVFQARSGGSGGEDSPGSDAEEPSTKVEESCEGGGFDIFWGPPQRGKALQWGDMTMFGFGRALVVCEDFLRGSTCICEAYGSGPLSPAGTEFVIRDFECWDVAGTDECE